MSAPKGAGGIQLPPAFWYEIPHGYLRLDVYPTAERLDDLARQILALPEEVRERADEVFRLYCIVMWEMQKRLVQGCAMGMHPDDRGGVTTSVLTLFSVETRNVDPKAALVTLMASGAGESAETGIVPVELPCGLGFQTETVRRTMAPGRPEGGGDEPEQQPVWQGTIAIPDVRSSAIIAVQLVTSSVDLADDYRNVLRGVASTVSFTNPALADGASGAVEPEPGSAAEAVRNDFG
ncbi:hypothetical protein E4198_05130 [Streptomyces sp. RKND-216]|uniref:hypothetical protein n=1 Tax=Streptomyces sp. RKND-216 TaxID=2562581 RepID=UPI000410BFA1|nr:hypothetical protein [Streptomyces sp. RKND-216]THA24205.1 hypothetical protein E4198_05130 [Streptomyces sp. RKND-216]